VPGVTGCVLQRPAPPLLRIRNTALMRVFEIHGVALKACKFITIMPLHQSGMFLSHALNNRVFSGYLR
jgi:hypothetical protein